ncbi:MAG TPA: DUF6489 family protein, partial [Phenylobacterium sp.]|nr:DUF6489 family protein [Phenylobacterium sp.]
MKMTIEIDCTPQEARTFLGLPDVTGLVPPEEGELRQG